MSLLDDSKRESIELWTADAIALDDGLASVYLDAVPITHRAQKQALMDLYERLDTDSLARGATPDEVMMAKERGRQGHGLVME
jgi:hypothetical protein